MLSKGEQDVLDRTWYRVVSTYIDPEEPRVNNMTERVSGNIVGERLSGLVADIRCGETLSIIVMVDKKQGRV